MWYRATVASVSNGNNIIEITTGDDISLIQEDGGLVFSGESPVQIKRGYVDGQGNKFVELYEPWPYTSKTNQPLVSFPTDASFAEATAELRRVIDTLTIASTSEAQSGVDDEKIMTPLKTKESVDFRLDQRLEDVNEALSVVEAANPFPYAMRKVEFEARRAANNEKFAASGFVHFGKSFSPATTYYVNEGLWCKADNIAYTNKMMMGWSVSGQTKGSSKTDFPEIVISGVTFKLLKLSNNILSGDASVIKLPPAEDGTRTYDSTTGISVNHATPAIAFASETDTNKVVTERVDMWGFEAFLREIHDEDPFVYANGLIQSLAPTINGVTTVNDNVRPITYFAWYEGDDGSRGKGVNWQTATEAQRIAIASDPENNIYFDDATGKFYQWCIRGRSFAGIGNGDWDTVDANRTANLTLRQQPVGTSQRTPPQGLLNTSPETGEGSNYYSNTESEYNLNPKIGLFTSRRNDVSSGGFSYFLVCGTINRLNKGAYHPSFNPSGAAATVSADGNGNVVGSYWYNGHSIPFTDKSQCFNNQIYGASSAVAGSYDNTGSIYSVSAQKSGRPDGRLYDAIYASGQGGVCRDMRYSAWGLDQEDFAEVDLKIKDGNYRGSELLTKIKTITVGHVNSKDVTFGLYTTAGRVQIYGKNSKGVDFSSSNFKIGDLFRIHNTFTGEILLGKIYVLADSNIWVEDPENVSTGWGFGSATNSTEGIYIEEVELINSVSSEYTHTEVIGDPANIAQCDDLKEGWVGTWNPTIPNGSGDRFTVTRKIVSTSDDICFYSSDNGDSWGSTPSAFNLIESSNSVAHPTVFNSGSVIIYQFKARAKCTIDSENTEIYGGDSGIKNIIASSDAYALGRGTLLKESLTGKVRGLSSYTNGAVQSMTTNVVTLDRGKLIGTTRAAYGPSHDPIVIDGNADVDGFKALNYNVVENQQGFINYAYTELKHNGTDWGDDGKIYIADNQSTRTDDNGNTVLYGTARIVEPLGWIKNDK